MPLLRASIFFSVLLSVLSSVVAQEEAPLTLKLVSEVASILPGKPFYLGIALHHGTGWHSYWKFPGVVGVPTSIKWKDLPAGFTAEPITWPEPESVLMFQIKAQGYERDVVLPIKITPPAGLKDGATVTLAGKAAYMCCNRQCNPGFEDLSITLPVKAASPATTGWHDKIHHELALQPRTSETWNATSVEGEEKIVLTLKPGPGAAAISADEAAKVIFFTEDGLIDSDKPQQVERRGDGSLAFTLVKTSYIVGGKPTKMTGVLLHPAGWEAGGKLRCLRVVASLVAAK